MPTAPQQPGRPPQPAASARALGYRMPAEWEPQTAVWVTPPHNPETWPNCLSEAQAQFAEFVAALRQVVAVRTTVELGIATNDSWIRDYGPIFVVKASPKSEAQSPRLAAAPSPTLDPGPCTLDSGSRLAAHDFRFNGWGNKYETRELDDAVPAPIAAALGIPLWRHDLVLEGGSIDVNGAGTVLTTEQCLLNLNRNPHLSRADLERELHEALGTRHVIWLPGGIEGDDTDGHIDDIARFVNPTTVVAVRAPAGHPDHETLERDWDALRQARDQDGRALELIELPVPEPVLNDFPADRFGLGGVHPVPASYANFLLSNGTVLAPIFGQHTDDLALRTLERALPGWRVVGLRAERLVVGLGAFHCLTQQQPRAICDL